MNVELYRETAAARRDNYAFLARMFRDEADAALIAELRRLSFDGVEGEAGMVEGMRQLSRYLRDAGFDVRTDLAVDYAQTFLGIGSADGNAAHPYESVYTSEDRLIMQDAHETMAQLLRAHGLGRRRTGFAVGDAVAKALADSTEPADSVAIELEFMAHLIEEGYAALKDGNAETLCASVAEQRAFLNEHMLNWMPEFCEDVQKRAKTGFYRGCALMLASYLAIDDELLGELQAQPED